MALPQAMNDQNPERQEQGPLNAAQDRRDATANHIVTWFENLFTTGGSLGTFFAGFTLSIASSKSLKEPAQTYAAISSLLFVLTVLLCAACGLLNAFHRDVVVEWMKYGRRGKSFVDGLSLMLQLMFLAAVMFFFLVMIASAKAVGIVGAAFTGVFIVVAIGVWSAQFSFVKALISRTRASHAWKMLTGKKASSV